MNDNLQKALDLLTRIDIRRERNEHGETAYTVNPLYRLRDGKVVCVPDSRGWPTLAEAKAEAERIGGGKLGSL